jgi:hypothetical protein
MGPAAVLAQVSFSMRQVDFATLFRRADQPLAEPTSEAIPTRALGRNRQESRAVVAVPKRCDLAMLGLAVVSFCGALSLSYYCLTGLEKTAWHPTGIDTPVYDAKAVPRDEHREQTVRRRGSNSSNAEQPQKSRGDQRYDANQPRRTAAVSPGSGGRQTFSFPELDWNLRAQSFGLATSIVGPTSQSNSSGQFAPDAAFDVAAPVPEPRLWSFAGAAAALLIVGQRLRPARRHH